MKTVERAAKIHEVYNKYKTVKLSYDRLREKQDGAIVTDVIVTGAGVEHCMEAKGYVLEAILHGHQLELAELEKELYKLLEVKPVQTMVVDMELRGVTEAKGFVSDLNTLILTLNKDIDETITKLNKCAAMPIPKTTLNAEPKNSAHGMNWLAEECAACNGSNLHRVYIDNPPNHIKDKLSKVNNDLYYFDLCIDCGRAYFKKPTE